MIYDLIVAVDERYGLSRGEDIPWIKTPEGKADMRRFKQLTMGRVCVMGRGTYEHIVSLRGTTDPLPGRTIYVVSSRDVQGVVSFKSVSDVIGYCNSAGIVPMICGGRGVYIEALSMGTGRYMFVTHIHGDYSCDVTLPEIRRLLV